MKNKLGLKNFMCDEKEIKGVQIKNIIYKKVF